MKGFNLLLLSISSFPFCFFSLSLSFPILLSFLFYPYLYRLISFTLFSNYLFQPISLLFFISFNPSLYHSLSLSTYLFIFLNLSLSLSQSISLSPILQVLSLQNISNAVWSDISSDISRMISTRQKRQNLNSQFSSAGDEYGPPASEPVWDWDCAAGPMGRPGAPGWPGG